MKEKVVELLIYIMSEIQDNKRISDIDLLDLKTRGYTQSEISAAFSWIYENSDLSGQRPSPAGRPAPGSRRVLHDAEKAALSTESQGYLIQLRELGLLDDGSFETVIERAMMAGYEKLSLTDLREIVASVLFARGGDDAAGNRFMLNSGDTIH
ncbi:MAG TPA: DUF494 family protein [Bacteroidota bacterium]|nr:DUF494 family protein [Bacteroidota bacterium]